MDDHTKTLVTYCEKTSSNAPQRMKQVEAWVRKARSKMGLTSKPAVKVIQADNAKVFTSKAFKDNADELGTEVRFSSPHVHTNQALVERRWRTLLAITRALLMDANMDKEFWPLAVPHATFLMNRLPTKGNPEFKSSYHMVNGEPADLSNLRVFGSTAIA